jgi:hypothetical protein
MAQNELFLLIKGDKQFTRFLLQFHLKKILKVRIKPEVIIKNLSYSF